MTFDEIKDHIMQLDLPEKLKLIDDVWESIAADEEDAPLPDWQKRELDERLAELSRGEAELYDWQEAHAKFRKKYK